MGSDNDYVDSAIAFLKKEVEMKKPLDKHFPRQTERDGLVEKIPEQHLLEVLESLNKIQDTTKEKFAKEELRDIPVDEKLSDDKINDI